MVVEPLGLEEDHRVVRRDGLTQAPVRVLGIRHGDHAQSCRVHEVRLGRFRVVLGRADPAGPGDAYRDRHPYPTLRAVVQLGHLGDDLIERGVHEAVELDLHDRPIATERQSDSHSDDAGLCERRVDHALRTELVEESVRDAEDAAESADVLAQQHDLLVVSHRLAQTRAERLPESDLSHVHTSPSKDARYAAYSSR